MLKITYTENGFHLEHIKQTLEAWTAKRVLLCLRAATSIYIEPSTASFLLPQDLPYIEQLSHVQDAHRDVLELVCNEDNFWEISLKGTWVTAEEDSEEGIFICKLEESTEFFLYQLWQEANIGETVVSE